MNLSITPGKNNVGAYINDINLKSLDQDQATEIKKILNSIKPPELKFHEISKDINNPVNNDPALIKPLN